MKALHTLPHLAWSLLLLPTLLSAQSAPSDTVGGTPSSSGAMTTADQLTYTLSVSNSVVTGYNGVNGVSDSVNVAGSAAYVSGSERHPTSFVYSGGYLFGNNGQPSTSFQNFGVSQVLNTRKWNFVVSDFISFLPSTPRYGLAGIPGVGDYGSAPISVNPQVSDVALTNYGQRITNSAIVSATYRISQRTDLELNGGYILQRFLDGNGGFNGTNGANLLLNNGGINSNLLTGGGDLNHHLTAATTVGAVYSYSRASYPSPYNYSFQSNAVLGSYQHIISPRLSFSVSAGPQWTTGSNAVLFPNRLGVTANASLVYAAGRNNYSLGYSRGTNTGSGVLLGAVVDSLTFTGQRRFSPSWNGGFFAGYGHVSSLAKDPLLATSFNSFTAGVQANRRIGEHFSAFGSYALQYQAVGQLVATDNAFNGVAHVISFGVTYAPRPIHLGRR